MSSSVIFAEPLEVDRAEDCAWYQTFEFPDGEVVKGRWDYRHNVKDYLGNFDFRGKRALEIGPASGFLTVAMEKGGAEVVSVDVSANKVWDTVPRLDRNTDKFGDERTRGIKSVHRSWWYSQKKTGGNAKVVYCGAENVDDSFGQFDVGLFASILQHMVNPYIVLSNVARRCKYVIVTEPYLPRVETGRPVAEFAPAHGNDVLDSWWYLSSSAVDSMMETLNFRKVQANRNKFRRFNRHFDGVENDTFIDMEFYTHVYERKESVDDRFNDTDYTLKQRLKP